MPEGAFCPASAWIRESRSRQIQLKFEVRFACSPQCSSLLQHVAHGGLHRWHSLRRLHLADCSFALLSAFVLMENSSSYPVLIAEMQQRPHTHTRTVSLARLCAGHVCGNKCPVSVSTRAVPRYVLAPTHRFAKAALYGKEFSACPLIKIVRARWQHIAGE